MNSMMIKKTHRFRRTFMVYGLLGLSALTMQACVSDPYYRHRPVHDHRVDAAYYDYYYYPEQNVYFDVYLGLYYYHDYDRGWISVRYLPPHIHLTYNRRHSLKFRHHEPWRENHAYKHDHRFRDPTPRHERRDEIHDRHNGDRYERNETHRTPGYPQGDHDRQNRHDDTRYENHWPSDTPARSGQRDEDQWRDKDRDRSREQKQEEPRGRSTEQKHEDRPDRSKERGHEENRGHSKKQKREESTDRGKDDRQDDGDEKEDRRRPSRW